MPTKHFWGDGAYKLIDTIRDIVEEVGEYVGQDFLVYIDELGRIVHKVFSEGERFVGHIIDAKQTEFDLAELDNAIDSASERVNDELDSSFYRRLSERVDNVVSDDIELEAIDDDE